MTVRITFGMIAPNGEPFRWYNLPTFWRWPRGAAPSSTGSCFWRPLKLIASYSDRGVAASVFAGRRVARG
jgi:hypothetical protein